MKTAKNYEMFIGRWIP